MGDREQAVTLLREAFARGVRFLADRHRHMDFEALADYPPYQELMRPKG